MHTFLVLIVGLAAVAGVFAGPERIVGGTGTTIERYPFATVILDGNQNFVFSCGGSIINERFILTAAHCFRVTQPNRYRIRVGSTYSNSGGIVHNLNNIRHHPSYDPRTFHYEFSLLRTANRIARSNRVDFARIVGPDYHIADNVPVWAIGWGAIRYRGPFSPNLQHVQIYTINLEICRQRYSRITPITYAMLCSGVLDVGGRDQCLNDSGGPLLHGRDIIVGVCSFGHQCAHPNYPGINARVSVASRWIQQNSNW